MFRVPTNGAISQNAVLNFQRRLLRNELSVTVKALLEHTINRDIKREKIKQEVPYVLLESIVYYCNEDVYLVRLVTVERHKNKLLQLSKAQGRPLFQIKDSVQLMDVEVVVPKYVLDTLSVGPKSPVLDDYDTKTTLAEVDLLLENY